MLSPRVKEVTAQIPRFFAWTVLKCATFARMNLLTNLLLALSYIVSGKLGLMLALPPGYTSPIFPPAGIAVAAALIGGRKTLPWIFLGSLLLNIWVGYSSSQQFSTMGFMVATIIAVASMLQAAAGGWDLRRMIGYPMPLDHSGEVLRFLLLAPVICIISASLSVGGLLALGIIEPASFAVNWAAWWVGDTLGVVVMLPLVMIVAGEPRGLWRSRMVTVAIPILLTFLLFVMIFLKANQWEYTDSLMEFRQLSQQTVNQLQSKLGEQEAVLEETAALFIHDENRHVSRNEFHRFVEKSLKRFPMIQALEWATPVDAAHRTDFEGVQRQEVANFEIRERDAAGQMQRAGLRASFYPVTYIEPLAGNVLALGFDLASNPERMAALSKAARVGTAVMTPSVHLVQDRQQLTGVLLMLAVNPQDNAAGTVLTVLRMDDFMNKLLQETRPMLYSRLIDLDEKKTLYDNFIPQIQHDLYQHDFDFGTRHYRLETAPTPAYYLQHRSWQSWSVLAAGILGTGLLGALFLLGTGYTARIEALVTSRTMKLKESEEGLNNVINSLPGIFYILNQRGEVIRSNPQLQKVSGYTNEELENISALTFFEGADNVLIAQKLQDAFNTGEAGAEAEFVTRSGQKIPYYFSAHLTEIGGTPYLVGLGIDITALKQTEQALHRENEKNLAILRNASDGIHILDVEGNVLEVSDSFCTMLGYAREELIGMNVSCWDALLTDDERKLAIKNQFESPLRSQFQTRHRRKDGTVFDVEVSGFPLMLDGKPALFNSSRDITARVEDERELVRSNKELEQFSYAISHDMRQPLRMISSYLQLIQKSLADKLDSNNSEYFKFAIDGAQRLDQMLVGLLEYSRVGRKSDPFSLVDSRELLEEAILFLGPAIAEARANIMIEGDWPRIWVSPDEIERLLQNLIGNAVKYRHSGQSPQICVSSTVEGDQWRLSVADNGIGIDPTQIGRLFQVFQRLQSRSNYQGSGVGLALCRRIVEHYGGRIWAESVGEGLGSTFCFELNLVDKNESI